NGPSECFDQEALAQAVSDRLGRTAFVPAEEAELIVQARLERAGDGMRATLQPITLTGGVVGTPRVLDFGSADCTSLIEPIATVLGIMLNVRREDLPPLPPRPSPPVVSLPSWNARIDATGGLVLGLLAEPGYAVSLGGALEEHTIGIAIEA